MKKPTRIAITGAAGQISYSLLFRIASGEMLGDDQPVILQLLEIPAEKVQQILRGTVMELEDCAFPLLHSLVVTSDPNVAFRDADVALLVGAKPRGRDMERKDLIQVNAPIFAAHGRALNEVASRDVKVLVVGNPANTNALIAMKNAPDIAFAQFTSMMRLDHNRSVTQIASKTERPVTAVRRMAVWGNHSGTQYPDLSNVEIDGTNLAKLIDDPEWIEGMFIPTVQKRGESIISARGGSSAASAANAALDHVRDWVQGTRSGDWVSMGVPADGSYGVSEGVIFGFPVVCSGGEYEIVKGLELSEFSKEKISATHTELLDERAAVEQLMG